MILPDGTQPSFLNGEEKGIDVRIALDVMALAHRREYDVALVMSQPRGLQSIIPSMPSVGSSTLPFWPLRSYTNTVSGPTS